MKALKKERLSKLQKWVLKRIEEKSSITTRGLKSFFNKELRDPLTNKERVTLFKSIKNMISKGLIQKGEFKNYVLTEKGFNSLKVNVSSYDMTNISFKDYLSILEKNDTGFRAHLDMIKSINDKRFVEFVQSVKKEERKGERK